MERPHPIVLLAAAILVSGFVKTTLAAEAGKTAPSSEKTPAQLEEQTVTLEATVEKIDYETRMVTLKSANGKTVTFKAGEDVARLNEVKVGDTVVAKYYESLMMRVLPTSAASQSGASLTEAAGRAPASAAPAGGVVSQVEATVEILAIDTNAKTVTVKTPNGDTKTVKARHPENLKKIKVGDRVHIVYTEALAVGIEPKKAAK